MPLYEFADRSGNVVEVYFPASEAPQIGSKIRHGGATLRRLASRPEACAKPSIHFTSYSLPLAQRDKKTGDLRSPYSKRVNEKGQPVFTSMKQVREAEARSRDVDGKRAVAWD